MKDYIKVRPAIRFTPEQMKALDSMRAEDETVTCVIRRLLVKEVNTYVDESKSRRG